MGGPAWRPSVGEEAAALPPGHPAAQFSGTIPWVLITSSDFQIQGEMKLFLYPLRSFLPFGWNRHLPVICQNQQHKGEEGHRCMISRPSRKPGTVPLATYMQIYKKGDIVGIKGMGPVQEGMPHKRCGRSGGVCSVTQHAVGIIVSKQVKGKTLAKRINVRIEHIKDSKSQDSFLKCVKKNDQKKKEVLGSAEAPACSTQRSTLVRTMERSLNSWS